MQKYFWTRNGFEEFEDILGICSLKNFMKLLGSNYALHIHSSVSF